MVDARQFLDRFVKVYSSLPIEERKLPIAVIDDNPINWNMAHLEIKNNTILGGRIVEKLISLNII